MVQGNGRVRLRGTAGGDLADRCVQVGQQRVVRVDPMLEQLRLLGAVIGLRGSQLRLQQGDPRLDLLDPRLDLRDAGGGLGACGGLPRPLRTGSLRAGDAGRAQRPNKDDRARCDDVLELHRNGAFLPLDGLPVDGLLVDGALTSLTFDQSCRPQISQL